MAPASPPLGPVSGGGPRSAQEKALPPLSEPLPQAPHSGGLPSERPRPPPLLPSLLPLAQRPSFLSGSPQTRVLRAAVTKRSREGGGHGARAPRRRRFRLSLCAHVSEPAAVLRPQGSPRGSSRRRGSRAAGKAATHRSRATRSETAWLPRASNLGTTGARWGGRLSPHTRAHAYQCTVGEPGRDEESGSQKIQK